MRVLQHYVTVVFLMSSCHIHLLKSATNAAATIVLKPQSKKVRNGSTVSFTCMASGLPLRERDWKWRKYKDFNTRQSIVIEMGDDYYRIINITCSDGRVCGQVLRIDSVKWPDDNRSVFECEVWNGYGTRPASKASAELVVYEPYQGVPGLPRITESPPVHVVYSLGEPVVLTCKASGKHPIAYIWFKQYIPLNLTEPRIQKTGDGQITINESKRSDKGEYECEASNDYGVQYSKSSQIYIKARPRAPVFRTRPRKSYQALEGATLNVRCVAFGNPAPNVYWVKVKVSKNKNKEYKVLTNRSTKRVAILHIQHVTMQDAGLYKCQATSNLGSISANTTVSIEERPNLEVSTCHIGNTSIKLSWYTSLPLPNPRYVIEYRKTSGTKAETTFTQAGSCPATSPCKRNPKGGQTHNCKLTGLVPYTNYQFKVTCKQCTSTNKSDISQLVEQQTEEGVPGSAPDNITLTNCSNSIFVEWDKPWYPNGIITKYRLFYTTSDNAAPREKWPMKEVISESQLLEDLLINKTYYIAVLAMTTAGEGPASRTVTAYTKEGLSLRATKVESRSIMVAWRIPVYAHNDIMRYQLSLTEYKDNRTTNTTLHTILKQETTASLTGLKPELKYKLVVKGLSPEGKEDYFSSIIIVKTLGESPQLKPSIISATYVENEDPDKLQLTWKPIRNSPVTIKGYMLYYVNTSVGSIDDALVVNITDPNHDMHVISRLSTWTNYSLWIAAYNDYGQGPLSNTFTARTGEGAPASPPENVKAIALSSSKILVEWKAPRLPNGNITKYSVYYGTPEEVQHGMWQRHKVPMSLNRRNFTTLDDLQKNTTYSIKIVAFTRKGQSPGSQVLKVSTFGAEKTVSSLSTSKTNNIIWYAIPIPGVLLLLCVLILGVRLVRKRRRRRQGSILKPKENGNGTGIETVALKMNGDTSHASNGDATSSPRNPVQRRRMKFQTSAMISHPPIPVLELADHIAEMKTNENFKFSQEYESIETDQIYTWENSTRGANKSKNRYANIVAYDHSRVVLAGSTEGDYSNANYIDGHMKTNAYIATQGPMPNTFADFWRMVWQENSSIIVMMTRLKEGSRNKCDQYWPSHGTETYGEVDVCLIDVLHLAHYIVRTFLIQMDEDKAKREVKQFQFIAWPDHGCPEHPTALLGFIRKVKTAKLQSAGPVIVHCSAGVGRTGVVIVIDSMLDKIKQDNLVDIYGHTTCLRTQRNFMVQTLEQYIFIYDCVLESAVCSCTQVAAGSLQSYIDTLLEMDPIENASGMELEFKRLATTSQTDPAMFLTANLPVNKFKNRLVNILPYESSRVHLHPIRGIEGSDYVNASYIDGYKYRKAYIATQGPLDETTEDFWRMLWACNSTIIVMLTQIREMGRERCYRYWPHERTSRYLYFVVDPIAEYRMSQYIMREFKVTDARTSQSRTIRQFQFTDWPEQGIPKASEGFIDFIGQVHKTKEQFGQDGPITVHDSAGAGRTGVFVALSIVLERMRFEGAVDLFQTVKLLRTQRPSMVQTQEQYEFCYKASLEYLNSFDHYAK